jgi:rhodanese-related sulfurtransferase
MEIRTMLTLFRTLAVWAALTLSAAPLLAAEETPQNIPGGTMVSTEQAKELFDKSTKFIDTRVAAEFSEKKIKSAINVVYKEKFARESKIDPEDSFDLSKLPADKNTAMVFYCNGSPCWKGYKGAAAAIKAGYKKVYWYRDGIPAWSSKGFATE